MNKTIQARDFMSITSRQMTAEGYLVAPGNLARCGVQEYRAYELGLDAEQAARSALRDLESRVRVAEANSR